MKTGGLFVASLAWSILSARGETASSSPAKQVRLNVTLEVSELSTDGKLFINGKTNLPDGTELTVSVSGDDYIAQTEPTVHQGRFKSAAFTDKDHALGAGKYDVEITTPLPMYEPSQVRRIIGEKGENLDGDFVTPSLGGDKTVRLTKSITITGREAEILKTQHLNANATFHREVTRLYRELMKFKDTAEFRENGFLIGTRFNSWLTQAETLAETAAPNFKAGLAATALLQLGHAYVASRGKETQFSGWSKKEQILPYIAKEDPLDSAPKGDAERK